MEKIKKLVVRLLMLFVISLGFTDSLYADNCSTKLFSVTIDSKLSIGDVIEHLADSCGMTVIINDEQAKLRMDKKLYYVKLKNSTLKGFLNTILTDNDLNYSLNGNKLKISYLVTKTFRIHYISGNRKGESTANVTIANSNKGEGTSSTAKTGISITNTDDFQFWKTVELEIQRILIGASDGSTHYVKKGKTWSGPDGKVWEYNPVAPIVNAEAGMVTVTGTTTQISRVKEYIEILTKQIKSQVLIDVKILNVSFNDSKTTGIDWSQLYKLQNVTISSLAMAQKNIDTYAFTETGITSALAGNTGKPNSAQVINITGKTELSEVVKFLSTQGDVKSISSPRVMTLNNQPALISVGKELFYKITSSSTASSGGGAVAAQGETVDSVFAGILLDITPEIDTNGYIILKINPSVSDTVASITSDGVIRNIPPDLIKRQIATVIKVKDGEHAILGGLISTKSGFQDNKVPLLGDIPLIGSLFKRQEKINTVEELVLIITPHIIKNSKSVSLKDLGYTKLNEK
ncbi:MAG: pilus (MSHA type) biogenesis protein MshL [Sulfurovum sp.]